MAQYSLSKACRECIRSKKKCTRNLPACRRCESLSKRCSYLNEPLTKRDTGAVVLKTRSKSISLSPTCKRGPARLLTLAVASARLTTPDYSCEINLAAVRYMLDDLRKYPNSALRHSRAPFIHPRLYQRFRKPPALMLLDMLPLSMDGILTRSTITDRDTTKSAINLLMLCEHSSISLIDYLGFLQALIVVQILTLFQQDTSAAEKQAAHERQRILVRCSEKLWTSAPSELPRSLLPCDSYILAESVRRTLLVSYALQAVYCVLTTGMFAHTPFGSALPFDINRTAWEEDCEEGHCIHSNANTNLYSYREYVEYFEAGKTGRLRPFEKMLLVGCHGVDSVEAGYVV